jgi:tetratricopeptide (TPR) repeat protein
MQTVAVALLSLMFYLVPQTVVVSGRILDREGKPAVKAKVVYTETNTGRSYSTKTDEKGEFAIAGVAPGYYQVVVNSATGERLFAGKRNILGVNDDQMNHIRDDVNKLDIDLSTTLPAGTISGESTLGQGKLNKEQLELVRKENANAAKINRLINDVHNQLDVQDWADATETLQQLIALDPNRWEFYQNLGTIQANLSHYDQAVITYARGIEVAEKTLVNPADPLKARTDIGGMLMAEGDAYNRLDKLDEAIAQYEKAITVLPQPAQAYFHKCNALTNHGKTESALAACEKAIQSDPNQWEFYQVTGGAQRQAGKDNQAIDSYARGVEVARKAVQQHPEATRAKTGLSQMLTAEGNLYSQRGEYEKAVAIFAEAAQSAAYPALPWFNLCAAYYNLSRMQDAIDACDKAIASDPGMPDPYYVKASALFGQSKQQHGKYVPPAETREALNKYLSLAPFGPRATEARSLLDKLDAEDQPTSKK